jgi:glycosyltransferase involved in cell wall biosynthesis
VVRSLYKLIREYRPDLVHAHSSKAGLLGRLAARVAGVPSLFTAHGFAFTGNTSFLHKAIAIPSEWLGARLGQSLIAVSEYDGALGARYRILPRSQMNVVHNGLPDVPFRAPAAEGAQVNIAMVARFAPPKDHESVLRALTQLHCDFNLWFIGEGPTLSQVRTEAVRAGIRDRVAFMGARKDVPELLSKAHIFVLASNYEGLPISILEAMRAALPVVASDVGGVPECVHHGTTGFLVPRADVNSLRASLRRLIASPILRGQMGQAGRNLFQERFTAALMVRETLRVYESVLGASPKRLEVKILTGRMPHKIATTRTS